MTFLFKLFENTPPYFFTMTVALFPPGPKLLINTFSTFCSLALLGTYLLVKVMHATIAQVWAMEYFYGLSLTIFSFIYLKLGKWKTAKI